MVSTATLSQVHAGKSFMCIYRELNDVKTELRKVQENDGFCCVQ